jgi:hypothetical protein
MILFFQSIKKQNYETGKASFVLKIKFEKEKLQSLGLSLYIENFFT